MIIPLKIKTLSPFHYLHKPINGGQTTVDSVISDIALNFALANATGSMSKQIILPKMDYTKHLKKMPWKFTLGIRSEDDIERLSPPHPRRHSVGDEGGYNATIRKKTGSGGFKEYFIVQEVPVYQNYTGALHIENDDFNPFFFFNTDKIILRIGVNLSGQISIERDDAIHDVCLNTRTPSLLGVKQSIKAEERIMNDIVRSNKLSLKEAEEFMKEW